MWIWSGNCPYHLHHACDATTRRTTADGDMLKHWGFRVGWGGCQLRVRVVVRGPHRNGMEVMNRAGRCSEAATPTAGGGIVRSGQRWREGHVELDSWRKESEAMVSEEGEYVRRASRGRRCRSTSSLRWA
jgi:hypothetical protein